MKAGVWYCIGVAQTGFEGQSEEDDVMAARLCEVRSQETLHAIIRDRFGSLTARACTRSHRTNASGTLQEFR